MISCSQVQAALSARCDGERTGVPDDVVEAHLSGCAECRAYAEKVAALHEALRASGQSGQQMLGPAPDLSEAILAGIEPQRRKVAATHTLGLVFSRVGLGVVGFAYIGWAIMLLGKTGSIPADDEHTAGLLVDAAAVRLALAFGLLYASWRPTATSGLLPVYGALWAFSFGFATREVVLGFASTQDIFGLALLLVSVVVMLSTWLHCVGFATLHRAWQTVTAQPYKESV
ncbi:MAG: zf-HC2 domain-containing protein [Corynebacterium sp.]|nr:zf-HC2 domain-containing protein [Corynebacterium sp.]